MSIDCKAQSQRITGEGEVYKGGSHKMYMHFHPSRPSTRLGAHTSPGPWGLLQGCGKEGRQCLSPLGSPKQMETEQVLTSWSQAFPEGPRPAPVTGEGVSRKEDPEGYWGPPSPRLPSSSQSSQGLTR